MKFQKRYYFYIIVLVIIILSYIIFALIQPFNDGSLTPNAELYNFYSNFLNGIFTPFLTVITLILLFENYVYLKKQKEDQDYFYALRNLESDMIKLIEYKLHWINSLVFYKFQNGHELPDIQVINQEIYRDSYFQDILYKMKEYKIKTKITDIKLIIEHIFSNEHARIFIYKNIIIAMFELIKTYDELNKKYKSQNNDMILNIENKLLNYFRMSLSTHEVILIHYLFLYENDKTLLLKRINYTNILKDAKNFMINNNDFDTYLSPASLPSLTPPI